MRELKRNSKMWGDDLLLVIEALSVIERKTLIETVISKGRCISEPEVQEAIYRLQLTKLESRRGPMGIS